MASASAASAPPRVLFDEIDAEAIELLATCVSTWITLMPAVFICCIGVIRACTSVGAISTAAGLEAVTECTIGICSEAAKSVGPCTEML